MLIFLFLIRFITITVFHDIIPIFTDKKFSDEDSIYFTYIYGIITTVSYLTGTLRLIEPSVFRLILRTLYTIKNKVGCKGNLLTKN